MVIGHWSFAQTTNLPPATVSFLDGSFLRGEIEALDGETLKWRHANARQPIEFSTTNLNLIRLPQRPQATVTNAGQICRVQLVGGDEFEGRLVSLDSESFEVETWFAGRLRGRRAGLLSFIFANTGHAAYYEGPRAADEWRSSLAGTVVNRGMGDVPIFGGGNVFLQPNLRFMNAVRPAAEGVRVVEPEPRPAVKKGPTPQELVTQLKAELASLSEKVSPVVKQALEKRLKEAEELAAKEPARAGEPNPPPKARLDPAVDPAVQALKMQMDRTVGEAIGPRPVPGQLKLSDISTMNVHAFRATTIGQFLDSNLMHAAVEAGLASRRATEDWLARRVEAGGSLSNLLRSEAGLLSARLVRGLDQFKNDGNADLYARMFDLAAKAPGAAPNALAEPPPAARKIFAEDEVTRLTDAAEKAATVADFLKSELVTTALAEKQTSRATLDRWFAEFEQPVNWQGDAVKTARFKAMVRAETDLLGRRLLGRAAVFVEIPAEVAEAQALGNAAANALADARARALGALGLNNANLALGAEGVLAGRAAAASSNAWVFRDGAYYSTGVGTLGRECLLPTKARIDFDLAWKGQPYFRFSFYTRSTDNFDYSDGWQFYTSSSGYIYSMRRSGMGATSSTGARVPQMLTKSTVRLTFFVNTEAETVTLLADGEKVHEWKGLGSPGNGTGVVFYNYNGNSRVRLSDVHIAPWDGRADRPEPPGAPGTEPDKLVEVPPPDTAVVEFMNQDRATGTLHGIRDGKLVFNPAGARLEIPLTRAAMITFPVSAAADLPELAGVQVTLHRNERLTLALEKWQAGEIIAVSPVFGRLKLKPESVRALRFNPSAPRGPVDEWSGP